MKKFLMTAFMATLLCCLCLLSACKNGTSGNETLPAQTDAVTDQHTAGAENTAAETVGAAAAETATEAHSAATEPQTVTENTVAVTETDATVDIDTDGDTSVESTAADTEGRTEESTEAATQMPRFDYFEADVSANVNIDASVYTDMKLTLPASLQITDEDVMAYIDYVRYMYYRVADNGTTKVTDQPLRDGDSAFIYYRGTVDGVEFKGGSNMGGETPFELVLGSGSFIPGFEAELVGLVPENSSKEQPFEVKVTFPKDYEQNSELKGKEAIFYVVVEYAIQYTVPEYTRSFVVDTLGYQPQETIYVSDKALLKEFEASIKKQMEAQNESSIEYAKIDTLWKYLTEQAVCQNKPQEELDFYYNSYVSEIEYQYKLYSDQYASDPNFKETFPDIASFAIWYMGMEKDADWQKELHEMADLMVQKDMICHAIAEAQGMEQVTDEEYKAELDYWVSQYGGYVSAEEIENAMGKAYLTESAFAEKMGQWLMERATFTFEAEDSAEPNTPEEA